MPASATGIARRTFDGTLAVPTAVDSASTAVLPRMSAGESRKFCVTTFGSDPGYDELVATRDIPIRSVQEHHPLPFAGVARVGYLPGDRLVGLAKLARVVELLAHGPQVRERDDAPALDQFLAMAADRII